MAYGSAAKSVLVGLDRIQTRGLRVCLGAVRTSPACALQIEAGEFPLGLRRKQLGVNYWINLRGHGESHPTKRVLEACWERERTQKISFGWTRHAAARELGVHDMEFCPTVVWPVIPVWVMETMVVAMKLLEMKARREGVDLVSESYAYEEAKYRDYVQLYTDGSKDPETGSTGAAVPGHRWGICRSTSNFLRVFTVEMYAILMALEWVGERRPNKALVCSDSVSVLWSIRSGTSYSRQDLLYEIMSVHTAMR